MTDMFELPAFLRRTSTKPGELPVTPAPATAPTKTRQARKDAYCFTVRGKIPLNMTDAATLSAAIDAVQAIEKTLPAGSTVEITATMGKI